MTTLPRRSVRSALTPAARAMRTQRIFARMQEGASYNDIAAEERISRERLRQIIHAALAGGKGPHAPNHKRMQVARLAPALRLAANGIAEGEAKAIPLLLQLLDRLDRYADPDEYFESPRLHEFTSPRHVRRTVKALGEPSLGTRVEFAAAVGPNAQQDAPTP